MITIPIAILLFPAEPNANAMGDAPKTVAKLVIKIGRKRIVAASMAASLISMPFSRN